jgi:PAS domain S-box-containing protein
VEGVDSVQILDGLAAFAALLDADGRVRHVNPAPLMLAGLDASDVTDRPFWDCYWWTYDPKVQDTIERAVRAAAGGDTVHFDIEARTEGEGRLWVAFRCSPVRDPDGGVAHVLASGTDLQPWKDAEAERLAVNTIIEASADYIGIATPEGRLVYLNEGGRRMLGYSRDDDLDGIEIAKFRSPRGRAILNEAIPHAIRHGTWVGETEFLTRSGRTIPVSQSLVAHYAEDGSVERFSTIARDITQLHEARLREQRLLRELSHRVQNTLAVVQGMMRQTLRTSKDPAAFAEAFQRRIQGLAISHTLLTDAHWGRVTVAAVVNRQVAASVPQFTDRIELRGPSLELTPEVATKFGMITHELLSNAVRFGALRHRDGSLVVEWGERDGALHVEWRESGLGDEPSEGRHGYGMQLLASTVQNLRRTFTRDGLALGFDLPLGEGRPGG